MGTEFHISVADSKPPKEIASIVLNAFQEVDRIEKLMSEWRPDSEISRINQAAGVRPIQVSEETYSILRKAIDLSTACGGAFDPTWAAFRGVWNFKRQPPQLPLKSELESARS